MAGSQPSFPFPLEGHASKTGPTANLGALGFLFWGHPAGPRAPWAPWPARLPGALAAGSPGPRGVERPLWPRVLVCLEPGWPPPSGLDVFLGNFGALGFIAGSALASFREGPQWALGGQRPGCAGPKGV